MVKTIDIHRFNSKGKDAFVTVVRAKSSDILNEVDKILNDPTMTEVVLGLDGKPVQIEIKYFERRFEFAEHLWKCFGHGMPLSHLMGDTNLWDWLSASWMRTLVKSSGESLEKVFGKQQDRLVMSNKLFYYHRHLVSGPFFAYEANYPDTKNAMCMLATPVIAPGEVVERVAGKRSMSIGSVCHLATLLYFDPISGKLRDGHTSSPGNPKAFSYYFSQLDVNVDYPGMTVDALLNLLPSNFERWVDLAKDERAKGLS
jgi:hypothetical protein